MDRQLRRTNASHTQSIAITRATTALVGQELKEDGTGTSSRAVMCFLRAWMTHSVVGPLSVCHLHNPILRRSDAGHGWLSGLVPFSTREMLRNILSCTDCPTYIQGMYPSSSCAITMPLRIMPQDLHPRTPPCSPSIFLVTLTYSLLHLCRARMHAAFFPAPCLIHSRRACRTTCHSTLCSR